MDKGVILIGHGSGGKLSRELVEKIFSANFSNPALNLLNDSAVLTLESNTISYTTDSYVIDPIFFPGGNIGQLAVSGTVNDLCVSGAIPKYLTAGFIIEEGFSIDDLERVVKSMAMEAKRAGIEIVAGDTKVVKRGQCDKLFINTSGIGILPDNRAHIGIGNTIKPGDKIIVSGSLGDHAIAILAAREKLILDADICSDAAPLNVVTEKILKVPASICYMRDITRGGLATVLVESCQQKSFGMFIYEEFVPVKPGVRAICELYGFDPLYLANEGKVMVIVKNGEEENILNLLHSESLAADAQLIGEITAEHPQRVIMESVIGGRRIVEMLSGEMLPRIC
jgi:hydrogenase expression/formation protein HypE